MSFTKEDWANWLEKANKCTTHTSEDFTKYSHIDKTLFEKCSKKHSYKFDVDANEKIYLEHRCDQLKLLHASKDTKGGKKVTITFPAKWELTDPVAIVEKPLKKNTSKSSD